MITASAPVTTALVALIAGATGRPVGEARMPVAADPPFAVVYPMESGDFWGPSFVAPQAGAALEWQITSVDVTRAGVEAFADTIRQVICGRSGDGAFVSPLVVAGVAVLDRELVAYGGVDHQDGVFNANDQYRIHVTLT